MQARKYTDIAGERILMVNLASQTRKDARGDWLVCLVEIGKRNADSGVVLLLFERDTVL